MLHGVMFSFSNTKLAKRTETPSVLSIQFTHYVQRRHQTVVKCFVRPYVLNFVKMFVYFTLIEEQFPQVTIRTQYKLYISTDQPILSYFIIHQCPTL
jgi:hypothetical protein